MAAHSSSSSSGSPVRHHLLRRQPVHHGDAPPLDVRPPLVGRRVGGALLAVGQSERGLQVAQRERPADGTVDVDAAGLGERFALAHVEPHELLDRVETVGLQHVLDLRANTGFNTPSVSCNMNSWTELDVRDFYCANISRRGLQLCFNGEHRILILL